MDTQSDSVLDKLKSKSDNLLTKKKTIISWYDNILYGGKY